MISHHARRSAALLLPLLLVAACTPWPTPAPEVVPTDLPTAPPAEPALDFLGAAYLPVASEHAGTRVGGLSALAWEAATGDWLALSDDRSEHAPARLYTLAVDLGADGRLGDGDVRVTGVTTLTDAAGRPYAEGAVDPEGLAVTAGGTLLVSSEGIADRALAPFVQEHGRDGAFRRAFAVPEHFLPATAGERPRGVRGNLGFEALTLAPGGGALWAGAEGPLAQDGDEPALGRGAYARIVRFDAVSGRPLAEHLYPLDPLPVGSWPPQGLEINGLVELLSLGGDDLLALERAYVAGRGNWLRLYRVSLAGADDVSSLAALPDDGPPPRPVAKHLVADLANLGLPLYNTEAMALGPALDPSLPGGRRLLLLVSDDNFMAGVPTQFLAFAVDPAALPAAPPPPPIPARVAEVQGAAHVSPLAGRRVAVEGTVTAVARGGFWLQDPLGDGDPATSEGVYVATAGSGVAEPAPGDHLRVVGRAMERGRGGAALSATSLGVGTAAGEPDGAVELIAAGEGLLPAPHAVGGGAPCPPDPVIDDDRLRRFEPFSDGADFWESLEGMRLAVATPTVVGPTSRFGELVVVADGCAAAPRTVHGGLLLRPGDDNPERLVAAGRVAGRAPSLAVGDRFAAPLTGVLDFDFDDYRLQADAWPETVRGPARPRRVAPAGEGRFAAATFNVENLSARDGEKKLASLADSLVDGLGAPALVALQEVQDDSGAEDDGTVGAGATLAKLVAAVEAAGGPRYQAVDIAPEDGADGGRPGGNIRTAFLYDPSRVELVRRGTAGPRDGVTVERGPDGVRLSLSPGRVAPGDAAWERSRKPLAAEFRLGGATLFAVNLHFGSKGGDDALFAAVQPPRRPTEVKRNEQARLVADFVAGLLAVDPRAWVVVLGDLNEFPFRPPVAKLREAGLIDLMDGLPAAERYTYVYEGNAQVLDHVLVSPALADAVVGVEVAHRNADFPVDARASDHDPVVVGFALP